VDSHEQMLVSEVVPGHDGSHAFKRLAYNYELLAVVTQISPTFQLSSSSR
jgi:hypothetical protein